MAQNTLYKSVTRVERRTVVRNWIGWGRKTGNKFAAYDEAQWAIPVDMGTTSSKGAWEGIQEREGKCFIYDAKRKCEARSEFACCLDEGECLKRGRRLLNCILTHICSQEVVRPQTRDTWPRLQFIINVSPVKPTSMYQSEDFRWPKPWPKPIQSSLSTPTGSCHCLVWCITATFACCMQHASQCVSHLILTSAQKKGTNALPA